MCIYIYRFRMQKDHIRVHVRVRWTMKHQNNPACTRSVKSLQDVKVGHYMEEESLGLGFNLAQHCRLPWRVGGIKPD